MALVVGDDLDNTLDGTDDDDTIRGNGGNDTLNGARGDDDLDGGEGDDELNASNGADELYGRAGNDTLNGGGGNDMLFGGDGEDVLDGGKGADILNGGAGADTLMGGDGDDRLFFDISRSLDDDPALDTSIDGGAGTDTLALESNFQGSTIRWYDAVNGFPVTNIERIEFIGNLGLSGTASELNLYQHISSSHVRVDGEENYAPVGSLDVSTFTFTGAGVSGDFSGPDIFVRTIRTGNGDDTITGPDAVIAEPRAGDQLITTIETGAGDDTVVAGAAAVRIRSIGNGNNHFTGSALDDDISADGDGDNTLIGGDGNDQLLVRGTGTISVSGGDGDDYVRIGDFDSSDTISGGAGFDTLAIRGENGTFVDLSGLTIPSDFEALEGVNLILSVAQIAAFDQLDLRELRIADGGSVTLNEAPLTLYLSPEGNEVDLTGETNTRTDVRGDVGDDIIIGGLEDNNLLGGGGNDQLFGNADDDSLFGEAGDDLLQGGLGDDRLNGGDGRDTILIEGGNDRLTGGEGADTFAIRDLTWLSSTPDVSVEILDFSADDVIDFSAATLGNGQALTFIGDAPFSGSAGEVRFDESLATATFLNFDADGDGLSDGRIVLPRDYAFVETTPGSNILQLGRFDEGTSEADDIFGTRGTDTLSGSEGADWIRGSQGRDILDGGGQAGDRLQFQLNDAATLYDPFQLPQADRTVLLQPSNVTSSDGLLDTTYSGFDTLLVTSSRSRFSETIDASGWTPTGANRIEITLSDFFGGGERVAIGSAFDDTFVTLRGLATIDGGAGRDSVQFLTFRDDTIITITPTSSGIADELLISRGSQHQTVVTGIETIIVGASNFQSQSQPGMVVDASQSLVSTFVLSTLADDTFTGSAFDDVLVDLGDGLSGGNDTAFGGDGNDLLQGGSGNDTLHGEAGADTLEGGIGTNLLDGGSNIDTAIFSGAFADSTITQTSTGVFEIVGADGTDTLTNIEFAQFDDQTIRLLNGTGVSVNFNTADPSEYNPAMNAIRDFDGNVLGGDGNWLRIGEADVNGDGDIDQILVNDSIARFATVGTAEDGLTYFDDHGWAGETRVAGIYIDPLVASGDVVAGSPFDSQQRFMNDLAIENINRVLGAGDYDGDGLQEVYFALTDGTAYLHAYMHADGNIQYANYQSEQQVIDFLESNGFGVETYGDWFA